MHIDKIASRFLALIKYTHHFISILIVVIAQQIRQRNAKIGRDSINEP